MIADDPLIALRRALVAAIDQIPVDLASQAAGVLFEFAARLAMRACVFASPPRPGPQSPEEPE
jgi:hypothetical protein